MTLETTLRNILKSHGFGIAAENIELHRLPPRRLRDMINSWRNYPKCMGVYPTTLSKKDESYLNM